LGEPTYTSILVEISAVPKLLIPCSRLTEFSVETHNELRAVVSRALAEVHSAGQLEKLALRGLSRVVVTTKNCGRGALANGYKDLAQRPP
jgi:hypothetical protein